MTAPMFMPRSNSSLADFLSLSNMNRRRAVTLQYLASIRACRCNAGEMTVDDK